MVKNWSDIKRAVSGFSKAQLLGVVQDLHNLNEHNRTFLRARYLVGERGADLAPYKARIKAGLVPKGDRGVFRFAEARKAITEYRKARGEPIETLKLMHFYVQCCYEGIPKCIDGSMQMRLGETMQSMFAALVKGLKAQEDPELIRAWLPRLKQEANRANKIAWDEDDVLRDMLADLRRSLPPPQDAAAEARPDENTSP